MVVTTIMISEKKGLMMKRRKMMVDTLATPLVTLL
jgi:hypothetical protein